MKTFKNIKYGLLVITILSLVAFMGIQKNNVARAEELQEVMTSIEEQTQEVVTFENLTPD